MTSRPATISMRSRAPGARGAARWFRAAGATAASPRSNASRCWPERASAAAATRRSRAPRTAPAQPDDQPEQERAQRAPAPACGRRRCRLRCSRACSGLVVLGQRPLALDHAGRDVMRDRLDDLGDLVALRQHLAAVTRVLHEAIAALVARHRHVRDRVDPEPRRVAPADAAIEQIDVRRRFGKQRIERLVEQFEPRQSRRRADRPPRSTSRQSRCGSCGRHPSGRRARASSGASVFGSFALRPHMVGKLSSRPRPP